MSRCTRNGGNRARRFCAATLLVALATTLTACDRPRLDEDLCPMGQPPTRQTILLIDASDPLSAKHREELRRMLSEMQSGNTAEEATVRPGEALVVYKLGESVDELEHELRVCNPGGRPEDWTWVNSLTEGQRIALARWSEFMRSVEILFAREAGEPQAQSPILEALGVVVPRHAPSRRRLGDARAQGDEPAVRGAGPHTHLIIFSDLLQHSQALSHYGPYPRAESLKSTVGMRHLQTDLTGIQVSLYRLERMRDARWQTVDHYYWWAKLVEEFGGRLIWQTSI